MFSMNCLSPAGMYTAWPGPTTADSSPTRISPCPYRI